MSAPLHTTRLIDNASGWSRVNVRLSSLLETTLRCSLSPAVNLSPVVATIIWLLIITEPTEQE